MFLGEPSPFFRMNQSKSQSLLAEEASLAALETVRAIVASDSQEEAETVNREVNEILSVVLRSAQSMSEGVIRGTESKKKYMEAIESLSWDGMSPVSQKELPLSGNAETPKPQRLRRPISRREQEDGERDAEDREHHGERSARHRAPTGPRRGRTPTPRDERGGRDDEQRPDDVELLLDPERPEV